MKPSFPKVVLITPVKNEEKTLSITIDSVLAQTVRPTEWVIVDDGSTDCTGEMAASASSANPWIRLLKRDPNVKRCFASVVFAIEDGIRAVTTKDYAYIGILDGDVRLPVDYYERILHEFERDPKLGLAGGAVIDVGQPNRDGLKIEEVAGAVQLFRRECFEALGGLVAVPEGGWDAITCAMARKAGYRSRSFQEIVVDHLKPRNSAQGGTLGRHWQFGVRDYAIGTGWAFETAKCVFQIKEMPWVLGAGLRYAGYSWGVLTRRPRMIPADVLEFMERERKDRLRARLLKGHRW